jgi:3-oxoacyl-[acyl-carrier protein] reductase
MSLTGKVFLITGASRGIGRAIALRAAKEGASVVVNYNRDAAAAEAVVAEMGGPERGLAVQADASSVADMGRLVDETVRRFGKIDVLIPNAGVISMAELETMREEIYDSVFGINVKGPLFLVQVCFYLATK